jgi:glutathione peroxidase
VEVRANPNHEPCAVNASPEPGAGRPEATLYDIAVTTIDGATRSMAEYRGRVLLVVNVASRCGFTPQYAGLEALYRRHRDRGFVVLGFPCNQFGGQEPGSGAEIARFCSAAYGVTFPLFAKIDVNGPRTHPLFRFLKAARPGALGTAAVKWNFTKFLVDPDGEVVRRYGSSTTPEQLEPDVEALLPREAPRA